MSWKVILTHLAAVAMGWACVDLISGIDESNPRAGVSSLKTKSGVRLPGAVSNAGDNGPLARWTGNAPDSALVERLKHESVAEVADSIWDDFFVTTPDGDVVVKNRWVSEENTDLIERFRELILADAAGVRDWIAGLSDNKRKRFTEFLNYNALAGAIPDDQLDSWEEKTGGKPWIDVERGRRVGKAGDVVALSRMLAEAKTIPGGGAVGTGISMALAVWPVEKVDVLVGKLNLDSPAMADGIQRLLNRIPPEKRIRLIESIDASGAAGSRIGSVRTYTGLGGTDMDLEDRLELTKAAFGADLNKIAPNLISIDVGHLFSSEGLLENESLHATLEKVRSGEMKADELLGEVMARLGKLAEGREDLVRERVFQQLARTAPTAAAALMDGVPAKTVQNRALALGLDPAGFEAALGILRAREPEVSGELQARFSAWGHKSVEGLARYGDAYVSWALAMPRSLDRDLVLSAIAICVEKDDPQRAEQLRAEKTYQSGWKPGMK